MFHLVFTRDGRTVRHPLTPGDTVVGRTTVCDLVIDDPSVSRRHARFRVHGDHCVIADLGGRNGTFLNGQPITEAEVSNGDTVVLGRVSMQIEGGHFPSVTLSARHILMPASDTIVLAGDEPVALGPDEQPDVPPARALQALRLIADAFVGWQPLAEVFDRLVTLTFAAIRAERAVLLIPGHDSTAFAPVVARTRSGAAMPRTTINRAIVERVHTERVAMIAHDASQETPATDAAANRDVVRSFLCVPLLRAGQVLGVLYLENPESAPLTREDLRVAQLIGNYAAAAVERARLAESVAASQRVRDALERSHAPAIVERMLSAGGGLRSGTEQREVTVLCAEIGSAGGQVLLGTASVSDTLNRFHDLASGAVFGERGTLDVVTAAGVRAVFGAVGSEQDTDHAQRAVRAAVALRQSVAADLPDDAPRLRIAVAWGLATVGVFGPRPALEFHAFGEAVDVCAQLLAGAAPGATMVGAAVWQRAAEALAGLPLTAVQVGGSAGPLDAFAIQTLPVSR